eukprot:Hpha_TRINITY_DN15865_c4_g14::TRINITY_DN15865_c4_g14_i2::g.188454::m.188454/K20092/CHD1L; chromodomain-helicase-DNA-binding protein 1-like
MSLSEEEALSEVSSESESTDESESGIVSDSSSDDDDRPRRRKPGTLFCPQLSMTRRRKGPYAEEPKRTKTVLSRPLDVSHLLRQVAMRYGSATAVEFAAGGVDQPKGVVGCTLRDHQRAGLKWLLRLYSEGLGGILGDDMGVGKTLQVVSLIAALVEQGELRLDKDPPVLVVAPLSTVSGWMAELERAPGVKAVAYLGDKEEREEVRGGIEKHFRGRGVVSPLYYPGYHCVVTTSELLLRDDYFFGRFEYPLVVIDEAHRLKSSQSQLAAMFRRPRSKLGLGQVPRRLLLTGTALQNNTIELWSLLNICAPSLFSDEGGFGLSFSSPKTDPDQAKQLRELLSRMQLRRTKGEVLKELPPKKEYVLHCPLSPVQRSLYRWALQKGKGALLGKARPTGLRNIVMQLRKVCNHPYCFEGVEPEPFSPGDHIILNAGKLAVLDRLLKALRGEGRRVLLFSQFTTMLDILQDYLEYRGWGYERLDGSVKAEDRVEAVKAFGARGSGPFVFLLSTRAGGLGLNLTGADTVVLYDSDWNPHVDLQAQERAHRMGQKRTVLVYRLVTQGTVEDIMLSRALKKLALYKTLMDAGTPEADKPPAAELLDLIKAGLGAVCEGGEEDTGEGAKVKDMVLKAVGDTPPGESAYRAFLTADISALLDRARRVPNPLTDKAVGAADSHMIYEGEDYTRIKAKADLSGGALEALLKAPRVLSPGPEGAAGVGVEEEGGEEREVLPQLTPEEAARLKEERRRARMAKPWTNAGYVSRAVTAIPGFPDGATLAADDLGLPPPPELPPSEAPGGPWALVSVVGDVMRPLSCKKVRQAVQKEGAKVVTISLVPVNNSGRWGAGGLFRAVDGMAKEVGTQYTNAGEAKDLRLGDVHLMKAGEGGGLVALAVLQRSSTATHSSGGETDKRYVEVALDRIRAAGLVLQRRGAAVSLHLPRFGGKADWYAFERLAARALKPLPTFVHYRPRPPPPPRHPLPAPAEAPAKRRRVEPPASSPGAVDMLQDIDTIDMGSEPPSGLGSPPPPPPPPGGGGGGGG